MALSVYLIIELWSTTHTPLTSPLPLAAGLYYLAELIEEYSVLAKKILTYLLIVS